MKLLFRLILWAIGVRRLLAGGTDLPASERLDRIQDRFDDIERALGIREPDDRCAYNFTCPHRVGRCPTMKGKQR